VESENLSLITQLLLFKAGAIILETCSALSAE